MLTGTMQTLIRKELREHYATAAWFVILASFAIALVALSAAASILWGDTSAGRMQLAYLRELLQHPGMIAAALGGMVGVIACSGAFTTDAGQVTGVFAATRPVSRQSSMGAKFATMGLLIGCTVAIALVVGGIAYGVLPPPDDAGLQANYAPTVRDVPQMLGAVAGMLLAAMALSIVPVNRLLAVLLCGYLAGFTQWPNLVIGVLRESGIGVGGGETVADVIASMLAPALTFLTALYVVHVRVPLLERSTRLKRGLLALLIVPPVTVTVVELIAALVIAIQSVFA